MVIRLKQKNNSPALALSICVVMHCLLASTHEFSIYCKPFPLNLPFVVDKHLLISIWAKQEPFSRFTPKSLQLRIPQFEYMMNTPFSTAPSHPPEYPKLFHFLVPLWKVIKLISTSSKLTDYKDTIEELKADSLKAFDFDETEGQCISFAPKDSSFRKLVFFHFETP